MRKRELLKVSALILICIFGLSACKKNVGTPEDNALARRPGKKRCRKTT